MTAKNPKPLTRPRNGEPNHGKFCNAPGSLPPESNLPMQPSLKEQMHGAEKDSVQVPPFDHKACILCDHVIVQKILGNKCGMSGSLCCNLKECPIEARKRRGARIRCLKPKAPQRYLAINDCYDCQNRMRMHELYKPYGMMILPEGKESSDFTGRWVCTEDENDKEIIGGDLPEWCPLPTRAYLNKDVIKTLESWINGLEYPDCPPGDSYARVIALLRGDNK